MNDMEEARLVRQVYRVGRNDGRRKTTKCWTEFQFVHC